MAVCGSCDARDGWRVRSRELPRTGVVRVFGDVGSVAGWPSGREWNGSQPGQGASELGFPRPALGKRCKVRRRAERVSRPARAKTRRLRVLVVVVRSPRPARAVQRARPCAVTCTASQAPFGKLRTGGETPRRHVVQPDAVLEVAYGVLNLGVAAVVGLQSQHLPIPVGDEGVITVSGEGGKLGTGRRLHLPDNEPHRRGVRLGLERGAELVSEVEGHNDIRNMGALEDRMVLPTSNLSQMAAVVRTIFVSPNTSETGSASSLGDIGGAVHPVGNGRGRHLRVSPR